MRFGAHLPLALLRDREASVADLTEYASLAENLGFEILAANDHLVFTKPYLDSLTSLAAVVSATRAMTLMTTIVLPVVRGPVQVAKAVSTLATLSGARVIAGVGPGSHRGDYAAVNIDFEERWPRFEESVRALRHLLGATPEPFVGRFYDTTGVALEPKPAPAARVAIWLGSWGSDAGLRRVARLGDGWLASAYNTDPLKFTESRARLDGYLDGYRRGPVRFPNAIASMFFHITTVGGKRNASAGS